HQIGVEFIPGIGLFGNDTYRFKIIYGEGCGRRESLQGASEIEVEPEEGVMGDRPECWVARGFRITPEESIPMCTGTGKQGIFEHVDRRTELLPQGSAQYRLHRLFSHNVCSFLLLFSICYHQRRSEPRIDRFLFQSDVFCPI